MLEDLYERLKCASQATIPSIKVWKFFPKPRWSNELQMARNRRERLYNVYRRNKNVINAISWKKARTEFKALTIKSKKENF